MTLQASQGAAEPLSPSQMPAQQQEETDVVPLSGSGGSDGSGVEPPVSGSSHNEASDPVAPTRSNANTHEVENADKLGKDSAVTPSEAADTLHFSTGPGVTATQVDIAPGGPTRGMMAASQDSDRVASQGRGNYAFDGVLAQPQPTYPNASTTANFPRASTGEEDDPQTTAPEESAADVPEDKPRRFSSSPQLPDVARMSSFGDDLFSTATQSDTITAAPAIVAVQEEPAPSPQPSSVPSPPPETTMDKPADASATTNSTAEEPSERLGQHATRDGRDSQSVSRPAAEAPGPAQLPQHSPSIPVESDPRTPPAVQDNRQEGIEIPSATARPVDSDNVSPVSEHGTCGMRSHNDPAAPRHHDAAPLSQSNVALSKPDAERTSTNVAHAPAPSNQQAQGDTDVSGDDSTGLKEPQIGHTSETDKLTEDIIRSLSPARPTSDHIPRDDTASGPSQLGLGRESRYLSGVYDDYWAASDDKHVPRPTSDPAKPPAATANNEALDAAAGGEVSEIPRPLSPRRAESEAAAAPVSRPLSRRFSWEVEEPTQNEGFAANAPSNPPAVVVGPSLSPPVDTQNGAEESSETLKQAGLSQMNDVRQSSSMEVEKRESAIGTRDAVTSITSGQPNPEEAHEPPSPVSAASVHNTSSSAEPGRLSLAEEKLNVSLPGAHPALAHTHGPKAPTPDVSAPTPQVHPQPTQRILTFKEIREFPDVADRIAKFNDTRAQFAAMDSGLTSWLLAMQAERPEHANASPSFWMMTTGAQGGPGRPGSAVKSPASARPAQQQPYYQQYLNAAAPTTATSPLPAQPPSGSMPMGSHSSSSDFKHSSGQVGAKGKELLLAAGKAGKGLLSKGRHKFRGDKVFP